MCVKDTHNTWNEAIDHFTVACLVACPLNESEAGDDLVLVETSLLFLFLTLLLLLFFSKAFYS